MSPVEKPTQADREAADSVRARLKLADVLDLAGFAEDAEHLRKPIRVGDVMIPHTVAIAAMLASAPRLAADQAARTTTTEGEAVRLLRAIPLHRLDPSDRDAIKAFLATPPATPAGGGERERIVAELGEQFPKAAHSQCVLAADAILAALSPSPAAAPAREAGE